MVKMRPVKGKESPCKWVRTSALKILYMFLGLDCVNTEGF